MRCLGNPGKETGVVWGGVMRVRCVGPGEGADGRGGWVGADVEPGGEGRFPGSL